ncbi:MAG: hypothetical protein GX446_01000 [Chthonomonadales bacterium]|nr:hypothetical protein [Chthonomonadales bacterium]
MLVTLWGLTMASMALGQPRPVFACGAENDLYVVACRAWQRRLPRYATAAEAIAEAQPGAGVCILADGYPERRTPMPPELYERARSRGLRLYVEYPDRGPGVMSGPDARAVWERTVVASDAFGPKLPRLRILGLHDCRAVPATHAAPDLVLARVAGFDTAVFGLPRTTVPILYSPEPGLLIGTTKLSGFLTGRYAPTEAWREVWRHILGRLMPGAAIPDLRWSPAVAPSYGREDRLPTHAETSALRRAIEWFFRSRMLVHPDWAHVYDRDAAAWPERIGPAPDRAWPCGDGSLGVLEGFDSAIGWDGSQRVRWWRRNDCNGEAAGAFALAARALRRPDLRKVTGNIGDFLYERSILSHGKRADPANPAYGLIGWNDVTGYYGDMDGYGVYYGDDQARSMLGMMLAAAELKTDRWDRRLMRCLLANLRLTGVNGFQPNRIDTAPLEANDWRAYRDSPAMSFSPHYQSYMWACYLWAYRQTGHRPFLDRAATGILHMMEAYPEAWQWVGSRQIERSRMLLCLAWLVRVADTPEHRGWLRTIADDLLAAQDASGGIFEQLGPAGSNQLPPPASNEAYGTAEIPIIQTDDDRACDLLYACNFAAIGLHEAAAATGDSFYAAASDRLCAFLVRAQVRSRARPELDGAWFRAFDLKRWDYWASSGDAGWGAWCIESGWTQTWIGITLSLRRLKTSLWDATARSGVGRYLEEERRGLGMP